MTLEDFFTLTEMRDGLTAPARVQELISVMQKEKDPATKSLFDAIRQWGAVASSIAVTESRECIDLFVQLDGLSFLNRWLLDADKFDDDTKDAFVEESINVLLNAIVNLQLDSQRLISSGIFMTIENLLCHHSSKIRDKARALLDSWKIEEMGNSGNDGDTYPSNNSNGGSLAVGNERLYYVNTSDPPTNVSANTRNSSVNPTTDEGERPADSVHPHPEKVEDELVPANDDQHPSQENLSQVDVRNTSPDPLLSSSVSNSGYKMRPDEDGHPTVHVEVTTGAGLHDDLDMRQNGEWQAEVLETNRSNEAEKRVNDVENVETSLRPTESTALKASESRYVEIPEETGTSTATFLMSGVSTKINDDASARTKSESNGEKEEMVVVDPSGSTFKEAEDISRSTFAQNTHGHELNQRKMDDSRIFFSKIKYGGTGDEVKDPSPNRSKRTDTSVSYRVGLETRSNVVDRYRSNMEIDYGIVDALEVARQVAQEVEREVVDYKEQFCSSPSERDSGGGLGQAGSPESTQERDSSSVSFSNKLPSQNSSSEASSEDDGSVLENQNAESENSLHKTEKGLCAFDLNQEVCSDNDDHSENVISLPISIVPASKPAAAYGMPAAPLEFEGILGWKGSAATSAFRPASPRRKSVGDETVTAENAEKKRTFSSLNIDLNVIETGDDKITDLMPAVPIPASCSLRSGELSMEVSSRRHEKLRLDLNQLGDDGEPSISDLKSGLPVFFHLNSRPIPSPASSSSSMQRNFDLNDGLLARGDFTDQRSRGGKMSQEASVFGNPKQGTVISILGAKVEVSKKDHVSQTLPLLNGNKSFETRAVGSLTTSGGFLGMGPGIPFQQQHLPIWAFNGLTPGPTVSLAPMYRPGCSIPYMMDPRGAPVLHQPAVGPISSASSSYPQGPAPFMTSMSPVSFAHNGPFPSPLRPALDLNSGFSVSAGVNRESILALRPFFVPDHGRPTEELIMGGLSPSSSVGPGVGIKRKEPDGGCEPYPISFRQQQPPRK